MKVRTIKAEVRRLKGIGKKPKEAPGKQLSLTDPDARCVATRSRSSAIVAYVGNDRSAFSPMAEKAREAMGTKKLIAIADRGYFSGEQILRC